MIIPGDPSMVQALVVLLAAPLVGSFLGVLVKRLPTAEPVFLSRSRCPHCASRLGVRDLIPVVSWLVARGHCRFCGKKIGFFYPLIEIAAIGIAAWAISVVPMWLVWPTSLLGWALLVLSLIDLKDRILPDCLTLPLVVAGLGMSWMLDPGNLWLHALAAGTGFLASLAIDMAYRRFRGRSGLGRGDAKLIAASGAWVSLSGLPSVILIASATALIWVVLRRRGTANLSAATVVPFGPFLALATWIVWLHGPLRLGTSFM